MDAGAGVVSTIELLPPIVIPDGAPKSVDWRESGALNPIRDQKSCFKFTYLYILCQYLTKCGLFNQKFDLQFLAFAFCGF